MSRFLKEIVAYPRKNINDNEFVGLDIAYINNNIIVASLPSKSFPETLYRNSLYDLVFYLEKKHRHAWHIWNFRAEGFGYTLSDVNGRASFFPFIDHCAPPFELIIQCTKSINKFLSEAPKNVAVLHCKAGKGRSGTIACAYLIIYLNYTAQNSMDLYTRKRILDNYGDGVSIISQKRYLFYTEKYKIKNLVYKTKKIKLNKFKIFNLYGNASVSILIYTNNNTSTETLFSFEINQNGQNNSKVYTFNFPDDSFINVNDIQIKIQRLFNSPLIYFYSSSVYAWFNSFFENPLLANTSINNNEKIFINNISNNNSSQINLSWSFFDGFKGTPFKGNKYFDSIVLSWTYQD